MGRGDKRSKRGKISRGSYGVNRPRPAKKRIDAANAAKSAPTA